MRKAKTSGNDPQMALLDVRNTPMEGYGVSPAQLLMIRRTKTKLQTSENHLKPRVVENVADKFRRGKTTSVNTTTSTQKRLLHYRRRTWCECSPLDMEKKVDKSPSDGTNWNEILQRPDRGNTYIGNRKHP